MNKILLFFVLIYGTTIFAAPTIEDIDKSFDKIGDKYDIPATILKALSFKQSYWNIYNSDRGKFGLMGLQRGEGISSTNFGAYLTNRKPFDAINNYEANIEMGAAILSYLKEQALYSGSIIENIEDYAPILVQYLSYNNERLSQNAVLKMFKMIDKGYKVNFNGSNLYIDPETVDFTRISYHISPPPYSDINSVNSLEDIDFVPARDGFYGSREGYTPKIIICHIMEGSFEGSIGWFQSANNPYYTSAHYMISTDGEIVQMVRDEDKAHHAGDFRNYNSIGIEHEGKTSDPYIPFTEVEYQASAMVSAWLAEKHGIPIEYKGLDRPESADEVDPAYYGFQRHHNSCPGSNWDWDHYMDLVQGYSYSDRVGTVKFLSPQAGTTVDNPVIFQAVITGDVSTVKYFADGDWYLGESSNSEDFFKVSYTYSGIDREREVTVKGYDSDGRLIEGAIDTLTFTPVEAGEGAVSFTSFQNGDTVTNPVVFEVETTGDVVKVQYFAEYFDLGVISEGENFHYEKIFYEPGVRTVHVFGLNSSDVIMDYDSATITVPEASEGVVEIISPQSGAAVTNPVNFQFTATGDITTVKLFEGENELYSINTPFQFNYSFESAGEKTLTIKGLSSEGFVLDEKTITINVSTVQPELTILTPVGDSTVSNPVNFTVSTVGDIEKVRYYEGAELLGETEDLPFNFQYSFETEGGHTIKVYALGSDQTIVAQSEVTFTVSEQTQEGKFKILTPEADQTFNTDQVTVSLQVPEEIARVELYDNSVLFATITTSPYTGTYIFENGIHNLLAKGYNSDNEVVETTFTTFSVDKSETEPAPASSDSGGCTYGDNSADIFPIFLLIFAIFIIRRFRYSVK